MSYESELSSFYKMGRVYKYHLPMDREFVDAQIVVLETSYFFQTIMFGVFLVSLWYLMSSYGTLC